MNLSTVDATAFEQRTALPKRLGTLNTVVAAGALLMFAATGSLVVPAALLPGRPDVDPGLLTAFLLNVALILFAWRRSADLREAQIAHLGAQMSAYQEAHSDFTTGLSNRRHLYEAIAALETARTGAALLLLDLDHFKKVNDLYGHAAGDDLLKAVSRILRSAVPDSACIARLGGDEFAVLLTGDSIPDDQIRSAATRLIEDLSKPMTLEHSVANVSGSIGIATLAPGGDAQALVRRADIAMYEAKRLGRNRFVWFDARMETELQARNQLEAEMRAGVAAGEFVPFYQPLFAFAAERIKGFEVLARWNHPTRGLIEPTDFIGAAEASGLISAISLSVMRQALVETKDWGEHLTIAVNVSPVQFKDPRLAQHILKILTEVGFPPQRLELEITESAILDDEELALATIESLKNCGIRISLDDFGTGYASLTQLRSLPFDRIKIDRSFVTSLLDDEQNSAIVDTIAQLGRSLQLPITAEGIESVEVRDRLALLGCSDGQGYLFGRPVPALDARKLVGGLSADAVGPLLRTAIEVELPADRRSRYRRGKRSAA